VVESHAGIAVITGGGTLIALGTKSAEGSGEVSEGGIVGARAGGGAASTTWLWGWDFRKKITVQHEFVDSDLTNFPVYVPIKADADFHEARADGYDIRFTLSDGKTLLKYEREHWTGGNGSPATAHFWVKIPSILASGGATIYVYYGKSDAPDGEDASNVWDANFKGVWHFNEGSGMIAQDKSGFGNDGELKYMTEEDWVDGKVNKALDIDGVDDVIAPVAGQSAGLLNAHSAHTISAWVKRNADDSMQVIWVEGGTSHGFGLYLSDGAGTPQVTHVIRATGVLDRVDYALSNINIGQWYHLVGVWNSTNELSLYVNGIKVVGKTTSIASISDPSYGWRMAGHNGQYEIIIMSIDYYLNGILDEVRVSNIARTPAWCIFEYHNIFEPDNELTWGDQEFDITELIAIKYTGYLEQIG